MTKTKKNLSTKIIKTIKKEKIKPIPKVYFSLKYLIVYFLMFIFLLMASFSFTITYSYYLVIEPALLLIEGFSILLFLIFPIISLFITFLFTYLIYYFFTKKTEDGYKYTFSKILLFNLLLIFLLGNTFIYLGYNNKIEKVILNNIGFSEVIIKKDRDRLKFELWTQPEKGLLIGNVTVIIPEENKLIIKDYKEKVWHIYYIVDTKIKDGDIIKPGTLIKIKGKLEGGKIFTAHEIFPSN